MKQITPQQLKELIKEEASKLHKIEQLRAKRAELNEELEGLTDEEQEYMANSQKQLAGGWANMHDPEGDDGAFFGRVKKKVLKENESIDSEIRDEIEMRLRPSEDFLPYDDIIDISNIYGIQPEDLAMIIADVVGDREKEKHEDLEYATKEIMNSFRDEDNYYPSFSEFNTRAIEFGYNELDQQQLKRAFEKEIKDPKQLALFERNIQEIDPQSIAPASLGVRYRGDTRSKRIFDKAIETLFSNLRGKEAELMHDDVLRSVKVQRFSSTGENLNIHLALIEPEYEGEHLVDGEFKFEYRIVSDSDNLTVVTPGNMRYYHGNGEFPEVSVQLARIISTSIKYWRDMSLKAYFLELENYDKLNPPSPEYDNSNKDAKNHLELIIDGLRKQSKYESKTAYKLL